MLLKLRSFNELKSKKHFGTKRTCCLKFHHSPAMLKCFQKLSFQGFPERETDRQTDTHTGRAKDRRGQSEGQRKTEIDWLITWRLKPFSTLFPLYHGCLCTYPCTPGIPLTSTPPNIFSKPLAAFPHNHRGKKWTTVREE